VVIVGAEEGSIPDFRAEGNPDAMAEEARILSVMISRARHGVLIMHAHNVPTQSGVPYASNRRDSGIRLAALIRTQLALTTG
jgi:DNA helicase II / ATP-dependent DNA helicase PcrA